MAENDNINDLTDATPFAGASKNQPIQRIKVIGVGGGGNNAVIHMHRRGIKDVSFVLLNTDRQVLESSDVPTRVLIGPGLGAGGRPERARKYAEDSAEQIAEIFDDETDMVFITAGMGGGTGTGAGPVVARIAKEKGILTVGIVTLPFVFEGERKVLKAMEGADEMAKNVDSLLVINNERLTEIYRELDIFNAFAKADDTLLNAAQSITDIITQRGVINRDFNDVDSTLREGGSAIISTGYGEGPDRVTKAIQDALHSPLLEDKNIFDSKKLLMVLYVDDRSDTYPFSMEETNALKEFVSGIVNDVDVMWGLYKQPGLEDKVRITILASGFETSIDRKTNQPKRVTKTVKSDGDTTVTYGARNKQQPTGRVLSPDSYDDPENEELLDFETKSAISRNPYMQFMRGVEPGAFRGRTSAPEADMSVRKDAAQTPDKKKDNGSNDLILDFDDI